MVYSVCTFTYVYVYVLLLISHFLTDDEQHKIQVKIKPVEASKPGSNSDLTAEQLKKLTTTLTLMSPASLVSLVGCLIKYQ